MQTQDPILKELEEGGVRHAICHMPLTPLTGDIRARSAPTPNTHKYISWDALKIKAVRFLSTDTVTYRQVDTRVI